MKKLLFVCAGVLLLCTGCGKKEEVQSKEYSEYVYEVTTGDTVTLVWSTYDDVRVSVVGDRSGFAMNGDETCVMEFADTDDVLLYTEGVVPTVCANYPMYRIQNQCADVAALVLNNQTTMLFSAAHSVADVQRLLKDCEIYVY